MTAAGQEPLRVTLLRNGLIGLVVGLVVARVQRQPASWAAWTAFALWFSFGGHWVELFFLNWVRPRLNSARRAQIAGRMVIWLVGGTVLMVGARITVLFFSPSMRLPPSWLGGPVLVCVELLAHALLQLRGRPNFYNGLR